MYNIFIERERFHQVPGVWPMAHSLIIPTMTTMVASDDAEDGQGVQPETAPRSLWSFAIPGSRLDLSRRGWTSPLPSRPGGFLQFQAQFHAATQLRVRCPRPIRHRPGVSGSFQWDTLHLETQCVHLLCCVLVGVEDFWKSVCAASRWCFGRHVFDHFWSLIFWAIQFELFLKHWVSYFWNLPRWRTMIITTLWSWCWQDPLDHCSFGCFPARWISTICFSRILWFAPAIRLPSRRQQIEYQPGPAPQIQELANERAT